MGSTDELFSAIERGDAARIRWLVAADPALAAARDDEGVSALMRARYRDDRGAVDALRSAGLPLDVFEAVALGEVDRLTELVVDDPSRVEATSADGFSPLHFAAFFGHEAAARALIEDGAPVDAPGRGWMTGTPLHSAASGGHLEIARLLLEAGADPNARQSGGWTPLHSAASNGRLDLVDLLLDHGADPEAENDDGATVLALATEHGDVAVIERIRGAIERRAPEP
jgi:ankyrin repeat protein